MTIDEIKEIYGKITIPRLLFYNEDYYVYEDKHWKPILEDEIIKMIPEYYLNKLITDKALSSFFAYIKSLPVERTYRLYTDNFIIDSNLHITQRDLNVKVNPTDTYSSSEELDKVLKIMNALPITSFKTMYRNKLQSLNLVSFSNLPLFFQYYLISLFNQPIDTYVGFTLTEGNISFYHQMQSKIPNNRIKFGKITENKKYMLAIDYSEKDKIIEFPSHLLSYSFEEWKIWFGYMFTVYHDYLENKQLTYHPVDFTPPEIKPIHSNIEQQYEALIALQDIEKLGFKELMKILAVLKDTISQDKWDLIYSTMYEKYARSLNDNI